MAETAMPRSLGCAPPEPIRAASTANHEKRFQPFTACLLSNSSRLCVFAVNAVLWRLLGKYQRGFIVHVNAAGIRIRQLAARLRLDLLQNLGGDTLYHLARPGSLEHRIPELVEARELQRVGT